VRAAVEAISRVRSFDARLAALAAQPRAWGALFVACLALLLALYAPALGGAFLSDDWGFVVNNPWVRDPTPAHLLAILHPWSKATEYAANWAPVHLLTHVLQWRVFGEDVRGYHVTNVVLHALVSVQLVSLYRRSDLAPLAALLGGAAFLLHPANVEVVAWISEVKTLLAMTFALGALQLQQRRPALAVLLFALALLSKALAVFALPVAIVRVWCGPAPADPVRGSARAGWWLLAWLAVFALYAPPQWAAFQRIGESDLGLHPDAWVTARTIVAFAARYLAMAATGYGLSAFHDPPRALSPADPWWLFGALALALFAVRALRCFLRRDEEAVYWAWAIGGWIPIAQFFPFTYPLGDRYLYFPLPGLVGVALLLGQRSLARLRAQAPGRAGPDAVAVAALAGALVLLGVFAARVPARAAIWRSEPLLMVDAARNYPEGLQAHLAAAFRAGERRDAETAAAGLRAARAKGFDQFMVLERVPAFGSILRDPAFRAARADVASLWLERFAARRAVANQGELRVAAMAHEARGERAEAIAALEQALEMEGPYRRDVEAELAVLRRRPPP
jgi:hypothetical protein